MRITIEMTETESRSTVIGRENGDAALRRPGPEAAASDGGPPSETLLLALDAESETATDEPVTERGTRAGGPPQWLRDVIDGGAAAT